MAKLLKECPVCGEKFIGRKEQKYCGHLCANRGRRITERGDYDHSLVWERTEDERWICPYQMNVSCRYRKCTRCGWQPDVAKARLDAIRRKLNVEE